MNRGGIYWVSLESFSPPEFGKIIPGLVLSNSEQNELLSTVVILPISSQPPEIWPLRLEFKIESKKSSYVVIPEIRQVSKDRIENFIDFVPSLFLKKIEEALFAYLGE